MKKIILTAALFLGTTAMLSSCGIKPKNVDPPDAEAGKEFPRTYSDINTDPAPQPEHR